MDATIIGLGSEKTVEGSDSRKKAKLSSPEEVLVIERRAFIVSGLLWNKHTSHINRSHPYYSQKNLNLY